MINKLKKCFIKIKFSYFYSVSLCVCLLWYLVTFPRRKSQIVPITCSWWSLLVVPTPPSPFFTLDCPPLWLRGQSLDCITQGLFLAGSHFDAAAGRLCLEVRGQDERTVGRFFLFVSCLGDACPKSPSHLLSSFSISPQGLWTEFPLSVSQPCRRSCWY